MHIRGDDRSPQFLPGGSCLSQQRGAHLHFWRDQSQTVTCAQARSTDSHYLGRRSRLAAKPPAGWLSFGSKIMTKVAPAHFSSVQLPSPPPTPVMSPRGQSQMAVNHLTQIDLAKRWRLSPRTLEKWRSLRVGPPFLKVLGKVLYRLQDIENFEAKQLHGAEQPPRSVSRVKE